MRKSVAWILVFLLMLLFLPLLHADATVLFENDRYNLEVRTIDEFTTVLPMSGVEFCSLETVTTTGRQEQVQEIELCYDYDAENPDEIGKFKEDAPIALVCVDGFCEEIAGLSPEEAAESLMIFVNGELLGDGEGCLKGNIGWQTTITGEGCVVFPVALTAEGRAEDFEVRLICLRDGQKITECAHLTVMFTEKSVKKQKKELCITDISSEEAEVRLIKDRLYIDCPIGTDGEISVTLQFAAKDGSKLPEILWAQPSEEGLLLNKEIRAKENCVTYSVFPGDPQETKLVMEAENAFYSTEKLTVIRRENVRTDEPKGVRFAQERITLRVGQAYCPAVLAMDTGKEIKKDVFTQVEYLLSRDSIPALDAKEDGILAVRPGVGYVTARVTVNGRRFETGRMQITVTDKPGVFRVNCRKLNVRAGAGTDFACVGSLKRGAEIFVSEIENGWAHLTDGRWVCAAFLEAV